MKRGIWEKNLERLEYKNFLFLISIIILSLTQLFTIYFLATKKDRICILPPNAKGEIWVQGKMVSEDLLKSYSVYIANLLMTKNASNVGQCREELLQFCSPEFYPSLRRELLKEEEEIMRGSLAQSFYFKEVEIDPSRTSSVVKGRYVTLGGTKKILDKETKLRFRFYIKNDKMQITSIEEVKA